VRREYGESDFHQKSEETSLGQLAAREEKERAYVIPILYDKVMIDIK
jgi:hypothetical protein